MAFDLGYYAGSDGDHQCWHLLGLLFPGFCHYDTAGHGINVYFDYYNPCCWFYVGIIFSHVQEMVTMVFTLRKWHEDPGQDDPRILIGNVVMLLYKSPDEMIWSPEDIQIERSVLNIVNHREACYSFRIERASSGDCSFAAPEVLFEGKELDEASQLFSVGMAIYYIYLLPEESLFLRTGNMTLQKAYKEKKCRSILELDSEFAQACKNDTVAEFAMGLTSWNPEERLACAKSVKEFFLTQSARAALQFVNTDRAVGRQLRSFKPGQLYQDFKKGTTVRFKEGGSVYTVTEDVRVWHQPGVQVVSIPVDGGRT